jgi:hypothetical protein
VQASASGSAAASEHAAMQAGSEAEVLAKYLHDESVLIFD